MKLLPILLIILLGCSEKSDLQTVKRTATHCKKEEDSSSQKSNEPNVPDEISSTTDDDGMKELEELYRLRILALEKNIPGKQYTHNLSGNDLCSKTQITYLGMITTDSGKQYKLINSFFVTGESCRGISRLVVYDVKNRYVGNFYLSNLPDSIEDNALVYSETPEKNKVTISFKDGLPRSITDPYGGEAYFQTEE